MAGRARAAGWLANSKPSKQVAACLATQGARQKGRAVTVRDAIGRERCPSVLIHPNVLQGLLLHLVQDSLRGVGHRVRQIQKGVGHIPGRRAFGCLHLYWDLHGLSRSRRRLLKHLRRHTRDGRGAAVPWVGAGRARRQARRHRGGRGHGLRLVHRVLRRRRRNAVAHGRPSGVAASVALGLSVAVRRRRRMVWLPGLHAVHWGRWLRLQLRRQRLHWRRIAWHRMRRDRRRDTEGRRRWAWQREGGLHRHRHVPQLGLRMLRMHERCRPVRPALPLRPQEVLLRRRRGRAPRRRGRVTRQQRHRLLARRRLLRIAIGVTVGLRLGLLSRLRPRLRLRRLLITLSIRVVGVELGQVPVTPLSLRLAALPDDEAPDAEQAQGAQRERRPEGPAAGLLQPYRLLNGRLGHTHLPRRQRGEVRHLERRRHCHALLPEVALERLREAVRILADLLRRTLRGRDLGLRHVHLILRLPGNGRAVVVQRARVGVHLLLGERLQQPARRLPADGADADAGRTDVERGRQRALHGGLDLGLGSAVRAEDEGAVQRRRRVRGAGAARARGGRVGHGGRRRRHERVHRGRDRGRGRAGRPLGGRVGHGSRRREIRRHLRLARGGRVRRSGRRRLCEGVRRGRGRLLRRGGAR
mmetsp:Transcript_55739/g.143623  ORF Transcript_55739/g.143623 Transcript_55739/m.143623 type:complete len:641 (-) Transcript_55739:212-2134(-)